MREKRIRLYEDEREALKNYRDEHYPGCPLGHVVRELVEDAED